ncbi:AAA family ATPase [Albirhodobacter sp. R86504]|uniref:ATP-binding protein n=1 Tax=Albirhodobacter sp. R86504 TaxID=3093848 RepID=UPI0036732BD1
MMRLRRLDLDFFGHFTEKSYDFGPSSPEMSDFHIIYGQNEAGKTTTMEAFLRLLYGFPNREPYAFKHTRSNLRVTGLLEIDGRAEQFTRISTRANSLLNAQGDAVPEAALQSVLGGLGVEDYRKLLCLDDETIERGGEEIAQSKGDIGRLLFSAAAGVSDLSAVLETFDARAGEFYKKGGSKSQFAHLKRQLEAIGTAIKEGDVSASDYRKLKQDFETAAQQEAGLRETRRATLQHQSRLNAIASALPKLRRLDELAPDIERLRDYPPQLEIDPEDLVRLATDRAQWAARARGHEEKIAAYEQTMAQLPRQPALVEALNRLERLNAARMRFETAQIDLPKRIDARNAARDEMRQRLKDIGLPHDAPETFVLAEPDLAALEAAISSLQRSELAAITAQGEALEASEKHKRVLNEAQSKTSDDVGSDLKSVMVRLDAARVYEAYSGAMSALKLARRAAAEALLATEFKGQRFEQIPEVGVSVATATKIAAALEGARKQVEICAARHDEAGDFVAAIERKIAVLRGAGDLVSDAQAQDLRAEREAGWQSHLNALDRQSADHFEALLRADDAAGAARLRNAKDLGELRQMQLSAAEASVTYESALRASKAAALALADQEAAFAQLVAQAGLETNPDAEEFAEWLRHVEIARKAGGALRLAQDEAAPALAAGAVLQAELADALRADAQQALPQDLAALMELARAKAEAQSQAAHEAASLQHLVGLAEQERTMRHARALAADETLAQAQDVWRRCVTECFGGAVPSDRVRGALPHLHKLRELDGARAAAERQIRGMEADLSLFSEQLHDICDYIRQAGEAVDCETTPAAQLAWIETQGRIARAAETRSADVTVELGAARSALEEATGALKDLDLKVQQIAALFPAQIATQDIEALRAAVREAKRAISLRAEADLLVREIVTGLGCEDMTAARLLLADNSIEGVDAALAEAAHDLAPIDAALTLAIETRTRSETALNTVTGGDDIAALVARRRSVEAEVEAGSMSYLEDKLGHLLAERAIRRYRDTHRSGMMTGAEGAFAKITSGAYNRLTTQPDGAAESLIAITADGSSKLAEAMSKGTRFQLYLALRAAAYAQMAENGTVLPFFCDDIFETFDDRRTRAACSVMQDLGRYGQAIYLTHHRHVVEIAQEMCGENVTVHMV